MRTLVANAKKYIDEYVTVESFSSNKVVTHGKNLIDVVNRAKKMGIKEPVLIYVPDPKILHIY